jgi:hypothetical protein
LFSEPGEGVTVDRPDFADGEGSGETVATITLNVMTRTR